MKNLKHTLFAGSLILFSLNSCKAPFCQTLEAPTSEFTKIDLITGSWKDKSESAIDFTLFADGKAQSDNTKTLLYKKWKIEKDSITFTIESIGNGSSFTDQEAYKIITLDSKTLVLENKNATFKYKKVL